MVLCVSFVLYLRERGCQLFMVFETSVNINTYFVIAHACKQ